MDADRGRERVFAGRGVALAVVTIVELLVFLDISVVNVALPVIGTDLQLDEGGLGWVVGAYLLTFGGFQLVGGRMADLLGRKRMFQAGLVVFVLASAGAGLASSGGVLIAARAVQGIGAAVLVPAQLSLLTALFPEPRAYQRAFGVWSAMAAAGAAGGTAFGGLLIQTLGWPWIFLINAPIGLVAFLVALRVVPRDLSHRVLVGVSRLDLRGALLVTSAMLSLGYGLSAPSEPRWKLLAAVGVGVALVAAFVAVQSRVVDPLMPLRLLKVRAVRTCTLASITVGAAHVPAFLLLALYFQQVLGYSPLRSGLAVLPVALINIAVSRLAIPTAMQRAGPRLVLVSGMALQAIGLVGFARMPVDGHYLLDVLPASAVFAIGLPAAMVAVTVPAVKSVADHDSGVVAGLVNTAQRLGSGLGVTALTGLAAGSAATWATAHPGAASQAGLLHGLRLAFLGAAAIAVLGVVVGVRGYRRHPDDTVNRENDQPHHR